VPRRFLNDEDERSEEYTYSHAEDEAIVQLSLDNEGAVPASDCLVHYAASFYVTVKGAGSDAVPDLITSMLFPGALPGLTLGARVSLVDSVSMPDPKGEVLPGTCGVDDLISAASYRVFTFQVLTVNAVLLRDTTEYVVTRLARDIINNARLCGIIITPSTVAEIKDCDGVPSTETIAADWWWNSSKSPEQERKPDMGATSTVVEVPAKEQDGTRPDDMTWTLNTGGRRRGRWHNGRWQPYGGGMYQDWHNEGSYESRESTNHRDNRYDGRDDDGGWSFEDTSDDSSDDVSSSNKAKKETRHHHSKKDSSSDSSEGDDSRKSDGSSNSSSERKAESESSGSEDTFRNYPPWQDGNSNNYNSNTNYNRYGSNPPAGGSYYGTTSHGQQHNSGGFYSTYHNPAAPGSNSWRQPAYVPSPAPPSYYNYGNNNGNRYQRDNNNAWNSFWGSLYGRR
jgi:hypothetical protein